MNEYAQPELPFPVDRIEVVSDVEHSIDQKDATDSSRALQELLEDEEVERIVDKRGISVDEARRALGLTNKTDTTVNSSIRGKQRHYSRRGGRAYPEPSDSELDPNWNLGKYEPLSTDDRAAQAIGIEGVRQVLTETDPNAATEKRAFNRAQRRAEVDASWDAIEDQIRAK